MEAGGTAGGGGPVAAVDVRAAAAGAAMGRIRAVARVPWMPDACMLALAWSFTAFAHVASVVTCSYLVGAFADAATVAVGSCPGHLHAHMVQFIFHRVLLLAPLGLFLCYGVHELIVARCAYGVYEVDDIHA